MMHPLEVFRFCPRCSSPDFRVNNSKSKRCGNCGFVYYANPLSAVAAFIIDENENILVAVRGKEPAAGTYDLPGGFIDMEETGEQAIIREIGEETGLKVSQPEYLFSLPNTYLYSDMLLHTLDMIYRVRIAHSDDIMAADDVAQLHWISKDELIPEQFGLRSISEAVRLYKENY